MHFILMNLKSENSSSKIYETKKFFECNFDFSDNILNFMLYDMKPMTDLIFKCEY